jgi:GR25 family glycosyltransferase involved in LPS biosynthesis
MLNNILQINDTFEINDTCVINEILVNEFCKNQDIYTLLNWFQYLQKENYFKLIILIGELTYDQYCYDLSFLEKLALSYYNCGHYLHSWNTYNLILSSTHLSEGQYKNYIVNASLNIPHIIFNYITYPVDIINKLIANKNNITINPEISFITFTITTCKRYDLFEKTINSFLNCCEDIELISEWICIDDNSSDEDKDKMMKNYPFFKFYFKDETAKGHAFSMNLLLDLVTTPYVFHCEDDFVWHHKMPFIKRCLEVLNSDKTLGQCLINKNYAETFEDINLIGGIFKQTVGGLRYFIHDYHPNIETFNVKYGYGGNCGYWPAFSLRPGLNRVSVLKDVGVFDVNKGHFEMHFAYQYIEKEYKTAFLDFISCSHIGRLTKDRFNNENNNAYTLNDMPQFGSQQLNVETIEQTNQESNCFVISLERRLDRYREFCKRVEEGKKIDCKFPNITKFSAVDGSKLILTRQLGQLFNPNDYNFRCGMIGCALSHIQLWIQLIDSCLKTNINIYEFWENIMLDIESNEYSNPNIDYEKYYVIFEDDCRFTKYFGYKMETLLNDFKNNQTEWDLIFLGTHLYSEYITKNTYHKHKIPNVSKWNTTQSLTQSMGGTGCYIINVRGAIKLLTFIQTNCMTNGIDTVIQKACDVMNIYYCDTHLIYTDCYTLESLNIDTDIQTNYDTLKKSVDERIQEDVNFYKTCNLIVEVCENGEICEKNKNNTNNNVIICKNNCSEINENKDVRYSIDECDVVIHENILMLHPEVLDIGLFDDNKYSVKNLIKYI